MWSRTTADGASTDRIGWRREKFDAALSLKIGTVITVDCLVDDETATLPPCIPNSGRLVIVARVDANGTAYTATVEVDDPSTETIAGATTYTALVDQWDNVTLLATDAGVWLVIAEGIGA